ncbi:hypothetical protein C8R46DRAFT_1024887 [Mycena filopes]|nr:hypothetical protein C8R46DRAFT_1024887 [Mycena filopes]
MDGVNTPTACEFALAQQNDPSPDFFGRDATYGVKDGTSRVLLVRLDENRFFERILRVQGREEGDQCYPKKAPAGQMTAASGVRNSTSDGSSGWAGEPTSFKFASVSDRCASAMLGERPTNDVRSLRQESRDTREDTTEAIERRCWVVGADSKCTRTVEHKVGHKCEFGSSGQPGQKLSLRQNQEQRQENVDGLRPTASNLSLLRPTNRPGHLAAPAVLDHDILFLESLPPGKPLKYGESATDGITTTLAAMSELEVLEVLAQMKAFVITYPIRARRVLAHNPQLAYAIFMGLVMSKLVPLDILEKMLESRYGTHPTDPPTQAPLGHSPWSKRPPVLRYRGSNQESEMPVPQSSPEGKSLRAVLMSMT